MIDQGDFSLHVAAMEFASGVEHMYLAKVRNPSAFPHPPNLTQTQKSEPRFNGSVDEFLAHHGASKDPQDGLLSKMKNKVKKCPQCGKVCAFTLPLCNSCAASLADVPISYSDNVFTAFIFGIAKCPFPATISIRAQTEDYLVFDDLLALAPCHLNSIPTAVYVPDWRHLLTNPEQGLLLVDAMFEQAFQAAKAQFWGNDAWRNKFLTPEAATLKDDEIRELVISGMNFPPSQFQLHLQFMMPPLLPFHFNLALVNQHYHKGRYFPKDYVKAVLRKQAELGCQAFASVCEDTSIEEIMSYFDSHDVVYENYHATTVRLYAENQRRFARWDAKDFKYLVCGSSKRVLEVETWKEVAGIDASKIQAEDKLALQGYGRPYAPDGKASGTFYAFPRSPDQLADWTAASPRNKLLKTRTLIQVSLGVCCGIVAVSLCRGNTSISDRLRSFLRM